MVLLTPTEEFVFITIVTGNKQTDTPTAAMLLTTSEIGGAFWFLFDYGLFLCRWLLVVCSSTSSGEGKEKSALHRIPAVINHQGEQILSASARSKDMSDVDRAPFGS